MKKLFTVLLFMSLLLSIVQYNAIAKKLNVVTTISDYAYFAKVIGKDKVSIFNIVGGNQDAHFIRPKPSFSKKVQNCDVLIATGLDLELWLPTVVDKSGNTKVRSGRPGYVAASYGMHMLEVPKLFSRIEGGVHMQGNPHVTCSPINMIFAAKNIAIGFSKNDPSNKKFYMKNFKEVENKIYLKMFGKKLVDMFSGKVLSEMAIQGKLHNFLESNKYNGKKLSYYISGWYGKMYPLYGKEIVTYHKNWIYFLKLFGMIEAGTIEPKPGIPPTPKHIGQLIKIMKKKHIKVMFAANYFDPVRVLKVAKKVGNVNVVMAPIYVGGKKGINTYFDLVDDWINSLRKAFNID